MKKRPQGKIDVSIRKQQLTLKLGKEIFGPYPISTSRVGLGTEIGSMKTPTGRFRIAEKIGEGMPVGTVFKSRRRVKATKKLMRDDDLIMTRILWLDGLDPENANTHGRFIYIHGTNHEESLGKPTSHGCIRMRNSDLIELYEMVDVDTPVAIKA